MSGQTKIQELLDVATCEGDVAGLDVQMQYPRLVQLLERGVRAVRGTARFQRIRRFGELPQRAQIGRCPIIAPR